MDVIRSSIAKNPTLSPGILIGIDGGGSKTLALLTDLDGHILARGQAGPSNYHSVGVQAAYDALDQAIHTAFVSLESKSPDLVQPTSGDVDSYMVHEVRAICLGLGGMGRPADREVMRAWATERYPAIPIEIVTDVHLVLAAGTPAGWGLALVCGTGSIVYACDQQGNQGRAGGWGYLFGDEGSGYAIGLAALRAVTQAADGRGPRTALEVAILAHWGLSVPQDLVSRVYQSPTPRADIASLAELVEATASQGDAVAASILQQAGYELALTVQAAARSLDLPSPTPCALAGSVILKGQHVAAAFRRSVKTLGLRLEPLTLVPEPAMGAIKLARRLIR